MQDLTLTPNRANRPNQPQRIIRPVHRAEPGVPARGQEPAQTARKPKTRFSRAVKIIFIVFVIAIMAGLAAVIVIQQRKINNSAEVNSRKTQESVAKLMLLPDEEAIISEISDANSVKGQPFFAQAENGDQVLLFLEAAKIVIYRPSANKIVNAGPIVDDTVVEPVNE
jgi:hypothetical protein